MLVVTNAASHVVAFIHDATSTPATDIEGPTFPYICNTHKNIPCLKLHS
jgi:hypothetical protein